MEASNTLNKCPVCEGRGIVPNGFYNTVTGYGTTNSIAPDKCRSCDGVGVIHAIPTPHDAKIKDVQIDLQKGTATIDREEILLYQWSTDKNILRNTKQPQSEVSNGDGFEIVAYRSSVNKELIWNKESDGFFHCGVYRYSLNSLMWDFKNNKDSVLIYSVRRKSDNTVFSIGDEVVCFDKEVRKICRFSIQDAYVNRTICCAIMCDGLDSNILNLKKAPVDDVKREYEIKEYTINPYERINEPHPFDTYIKSVKRLSDGIVFSVGDWIYSYVNIPREDFKIEKITPINNTIYFDSCPIENAVRSDYVEIPKKPSPSKAWVDANIKHLDNFKTEPSKEQVDECICKEGHPYQNIACPVHGYGTTKAMVDELRRKSEEEVKKCSESPYYFMTNYYLVNGKKFTTILDESSFNAYFKAVTQNLTR